MIKQSHFYLFLFSSYLIAAVQTNVRAQSIDLLLDTLVSSMFVGQDSSALFHSFDHLKGHPNESLKTQQIFAKIFKYGRKNITSSELLFQLEINVFPLMVTHYNAELKKSYLTPKYAVPTEKQAAFLMALAYDYARAAQATFILFPQASPSNQQSGIEFYRKKRAIYDSLCLQRGLAGTGKLVFDAWEKVVKNINQIPVLTMVQDTSSSLGTEETEEGGIQVKKHRHKDLSWLKFGSWILLLFGLLWMLIRIFQVFKEPSNK